MLALIHQALQQLRRIATFHTAPAQLALGFTIGALIGLLPKENLIVGFLGMLLCMLHVSKPAGCLGMCAFMWLGAVTDPFAHKLGLRVLQYEPLQSTYAAMYNMPLGPWLGFNNTVVIGSLLLGVYFSYPVYWLSYAICWRVQRWQRERARRQSARQLADGMNVGAHWGSLS